MIKSKIVLLSALVSCALISGCKEENKTNVSIEFMHSSVEQERQAVISKLIARFEKENPGITVKQVPVEEDAYNTKVITLSRSGSLPEVIETSHDYAKVMDKEQLIDRKAVATVISNVGEGAFYDGVLRIVRTEDGSAWTGVPVSAWIGGIWYRKDVLAKAGLEEPKNWQQLLDVAQKLNDPANKKYGMKNFWLVSVAMKKLRAILFVKWPVWLPVITRFFMLCMYRLPQRVVTASGWPHSVFY